MSKSKYGHIQKDAEKILAMKAAGYKKREIAEELELTKEQIKEFLKRQRRKERRISAGLPVRAQGRPSKDSAPRDIVMEQEYEIRRLKMENELLRDFLRFTERM
jgi:predicted transcriptional regulator